MQNYEKATELQSLRTIVLVSIFFSVFLVFIIAGAAICYSDFSDKQEIQANANFVNQKEEESNWSVDFTLLNLKIKKGGKDD